MPTPAPLTEEQLRTRAQVAAEIASRAPDPSARDAFQAMARTWAKLADDLVAGAVPPSARWH